MVEILLDRSFSFECTLNSQIVITAVGLVVVFLTLNCGATNSTPIGTLKHFYCFPLFWLERKNFEREIELTGVVVALFFFRSALFFMSCGFPGCDMI